MLSYVVTLLYKLKLLLNCSFMITDVDLFY
jgi:hypothetical protein